MLGEATRSLPFTLWLIERTIGLCEGAPKGATRLTKMSITLYGTPPSPPSHTARLMLEHKGVDHKMVWLLPGLWPALLRTRGFRGGTVPAMKLDGQRLQSSLA